MKRRILLPTDFSNNSKHAINYALALFKDEQCTFYFLNVFSATGNLMKSLMNLEPGSEMHQLAKKKSEMGLTETLNTIAFSKNGNTNHHFQTISIFNNIIEAIKQTVEEKDIDMIVMGSKGITNSKNVVWGGVSLHVMEKVRNCPVIVIPERAKAILPKEIVFPTSYKTHFKKRQLNYLIDITKKCNANIAILHIKNENKLTHEQQERKTMLETYFEDVSYSFHELGNHSVQSAINIFVESRNSDMVAFINRKHNFLESMTTRPLVKELSFHSTVPILVMHDLRN